MSLSWYVDAFLALVFAALVVMGLVVPGISGFIIPALFIVGGLGFIFNRLS